MDGGKVVQQIVKLDVLSGRLNALIDRDDQLIGLFNRELPLCIDDGLHSRLNKFLLENVKILKVILLVDEVVFK